MNWPLFIASSLVLLSAESIAYTRVRDVCIYKYRWHWAYWTPSHERKIAGHLFGSLYLWFKKFRKEWLEMVEAQ